ncbi:PKD domain-containing protein [Hymenobacter fodinae]|uniref:PKD/Chitinase domain-containing protein n=1 Tax=Hymenobacter fodinae TaxID=2510796 RepID=A0A4Z0P707_9BACT|nr:Ig-like domain-containing protein [Hymenobacter fodinae]TGE07718.1 hypothetical protein EU556_08160 [Hymenobacter fodinae]
MASTISQVQSELSQLSQDITNTLQTGADVSGPRLAALLVRQIALTNDLASLQGAGASALRYGAGPPANSLGSNNDIYRDTQTGDEYQKVAGSYVLRQNLKGNPGYTPQKGKDYVDGNDGLDGNEIVDKTYAPTAEDNAGYKEGDQWFYTKSLGIYERYAHINGQWRLVFRKAETTTPPVSADTQAPNLTFTAPASGATVPVGTQLTLTATATDNVAVTAVEFLNGATGASLGQGAKNGNTYTLPYTVTTAGPLTLQAKASDAAGNVQIASVSITVQAPAGNVLPVANAGSDVTLQLPTNQVALMGTGTDSDGTITAYAWSQITGPNNATGIPATSQNVVVSGLVAGIYQFRLTVTDDKNGQKSDDVLVTVNAVAGEGVLKLSQQPGIYPADASLGSKQYGTDSTAGLNTLFANSSGAPLVVDWDTDVSFSHIVIGSNVTINAVAKPGTTRNYGFILREQSNGFAVRNANPVGMNGSSLGTIVDSNINIGRIYCNLNAFDVATGAELQQREAAVGPNGEIIWTIGFRLAGIKNSSFNMEVVNQRTFSSYISNFQNISCPTISAFAYVSPSGELARNSDGFKFHAGTGLTVGTVFGQTGDDLISLVGHDIFFPQYPAPVAGPSGQTGYDPWAVYGKISNVRIDTIDSRNCKYLLRLLASGGLEGAVDDIVIKRIIGTVQQQGMLLDNYAESPNDIFTGGSNKTGIIGSVRVDEYTVEMTTTGSYKPANMMLDCTIRNLSIGLLRRNNYTGSIHPTVLYGPNAVVDNATFDRIEATPNSADNRSIIDIQGRGTTLTINGGTMNRSAHTRGPAPVVRFALSPNGQDNGQLANVNFPVEYNATNLNNVVENYYGKLNNFTFAAIKASGTFTIYVGAGKTVTNGTSSNSVGIAGVMDTAGTGTVTNKIGNDWGGGTTPPPAGGTEGFEAWATRVAADGGSVSASVKNAGVALETTLRNAGIWSRLRTLYAFAGGTLATAKYNILNNQDTNAAYRLAFSGNWMVDSVGVKPDGQVGTQARTFYLPYGKTPDTTGARHFAFFSCEDIATGRDFGYLTPGTFGGDGINRGDNLHLEYTDGNTYWASGKGSSSVAAGNTKALYIINRTPDYKVAIWRSVAGQPAVFLKDYLEQEDNSNGEYFFGDINIVGGETPEVTHLPSSRKVGFSTTGEHFRTEAELNTYCTAVHEFMAAKGYQA